MISSWPFVFRASSSSFVNVSSLTLLCNFAETTEDTEGNQEDLTNAKEEAFDEEKVGQESEAGLDQWQDYIPNLLCHKRLLWCLKRMKTRLKINVHYVKDVSIK